MSAFSLSGFVSSAQRLGSRTSTPNSTSSQPRALAPIHNDSNVNDTKDPDWSVEGPGRRVYDNLTAIDWIFEYAKERQRQRVLKSSTSGIGGYAIQFADASQIWAVLIVTGLAVGAVAAFIDIASDWLGDVKAGFCSNVEQGGKFYLSKPFCCLGHDGWSSPRLNGADDF
jgi:chloride channel 3/4/5